MADPIYLYDDILYAVHLALESNELDTRYIIKINNNDIIYGIESELDIRTNYATGSLFAFADSYAKSYADYLKSQGYDKKLIISTVKTALSFYIEASDVMNYVFHLAGLVEMDDKHVLHEQTRISSVLDNLEDAYADKFKEYDTLAKNAAKLAITYDPEPKENNVTYYYQRDSPSTQQFKVEILPLNSSVTLTYKNDISRVYEYANKLPELLSSIKNDKSLDGLVIKFYTGVEYRTGVYTESTNELTIYNTKKLVFDTNIPEGFHSTLDTNVTISWTIYNMGIDLTALSYSILSYRLMSKYFHILETEKPYFMKKSDEMYFILSSTEKYKFAIHRQSLPSNRTVKLLEYGSEAYLGQSDVGVVTEEMERDTDYVAITLYNVQNEYKAKSCKYIISALLRIFVRKYQTEIENIYRSAFSWYIPRYRSKKKRNEDRDTKINALQGLAPEIFVNGYARLCLEDKQGEIIPESEIKKWKKDNPDRQLLKFPKNAEKGDITIYMACPEDTYRYPSVKPNTYLPNRAKYPYIPCCTAKDPLEIKNSNLYKYLNDIPEEEDIDVIANLQSTRQMASVNKLLGLGRRGVIPNSIIKLLNNYGVEGEIERFGAYKSVNSLIHCVMFAMDTKYLRYNLRERESYSSNWRHLISGNIPSDAEYIDFNVGLDAEEVKILGRKSIAAAKQELYDHSYNSIIASLRDVFIPFESQIYYRLLEVYYKVNIMVFVLPPGGDPILEIPRHKIFHIRARKENLPTILIFKHYGKSDIAHYEIIKISNNYITNTGRLFEMYDDIYTTYVLRKRGPGKPLIYKNVYSYFVYQALNEAKIAINGQYLDTYGKCRGYHVTLPNGYSGSILCMPQQPVALEVMDEVVPLPLESVDNLFDWTQSSRVHIVDGKVLGIWYTIYDYDLGIYIPVVATKKETQEDRFTNVEKIGANPLVPVPTKGGFQDFLDLEEILDKFLAIITTLYKLYAIEVLDDLSANNPVGSAKDFELYTERRRDVLVEFSKNFSIAPKRTNYAENITSINTNKIIDMSFNEGLDYIDNITNGTLVSNGLILMETKKLKEDIQYYVSNILAKQPEDFYRRTQRIKLPSKLFTSLQEFELWVDSKINPNVVILDAGSIDNIRKDSFIYRDPSGPMFIIQNVVEGNVSRACHVAKIWLDEGRVIGYKASALTITPLANIYKIYGKQLMLEINNGQNINLIQFPDNTYAALLPL